jgi:hypothetical protein
MLCNILPAGFSSLFIKIPPSSMNGNLLHALFFNNNGEQTLAHVAQKAI